MRNLIISFILILCIDCTAQETEKDLLFIEYNDNYFEIYKYPTDNYTYYLIKDTGNNGRISFKEKQVYYDLKPDHIFCLKDIIIKADAYYKKNIYKKGKINDSKLAEYLGKFTLFFVKENKSVKVETWIEEI